MEFYVNCPILYILLGVMILAILGQDICFPLKVMKCSRDIGMDQVKTRKIFQTDGGHYHRRGPCNV